ncbi:hypothetical protein BGZ94_004736 [Podila epigama]|nr:hypothetical protein BGZ94_004736 [Podila epigama]
MAQTRKEAMHEAYSMAEQEGELAVRLQEENAMLQARLADVGVMARKVINEDFYNTEALIESLEMENQGLREMLGVSAEDTQDLLARHAGNRVSFPSTGSYMASSGSDREHGLSMPFSPMEETVPEDTFPGSRNIAVSGEEGNVSSSQTSTSSSVSSSASNSTLASPALGSNETFDSVDVSKGLSEGLRRDPSIVNGREVIKDVGRKSIGDDSTRLSARKQGTNTISNTQDEQQRQQPQPQQLNKAGASRRNSTVGTGTVAAGKSGMTINTGAGVKKVGSSSTSTMGTVSSAQKTKKPARKVKATS